MDQSNWHAVNYILHKEAEELKKANCDMIAIASNTLNKFATNVSNNLNIPVIPIGKSIAKEAVSKGVERLGILGTKPTMDERFIKDSVEKSGISTRVPEKIGRLYIHKTIFEELTKGIILDKSRDTFIEIIKYMQTVMGIDGIALACTEIGELISQSDLEERGINMPVIDSTVAHTSDIADIIIDDYNKPKELRIGARHYDTRAGKHSFKGSMYFQG